MLPRHVDVDVVVGQEIVAEQAEHRQPVDRPGEVRRHRQVKAVREAAAEAEVPHRHDRRHGHAADADQAGKAGIGARTQVELLRAVVRHNRDEGAGIDQQGDLLALEAGLDRGDAGMRKQRKIGHGVDVASLRPGGGTAGQQRAQQRGRQGAQDHRRSLVME